MRDAFTILDQQAGFAYDDEGTGIEDRWFDIDAAFPATVTLPFPPESAASGIADTTYHPVVWYRIAFTADDLSRAGRTMRGRRERVLLHFGAVDYHAHVWVDGTLVGTHTGGSTPFALEIGHALASGDEHVVVIRAEDDPLDLSQPRGKQDWQQVPHEVWYDRTTGIWRSLWLEVVPEISVERLWWESDLAAGSVRAEITLSRRPTHPLIVRATLRADGNVIAVGSTRIAGPRSSLTLHLDIFDNGQGYEAYLWRPDSPQLIDATMELTTEDGVPLDTVGSYLGLRSVSVADGRVLLNDRPFFLRGVLSQGFWPESHLAAPDPDSLRAEAQLIADLGFSWVRIHQKAEDPRFLYWCDRLGLATWVEAPSAYRFDELSIARQVEEWIEIVDTYRVHPSVIAWVPINESWGVPHVAHRRDQRALTVALAELTRSLDPGRLVISNDGWEHTSSDLLTIHDYEAESSVLNDRYREPSRSGIGPAGRRLTVGKPFADDAPVLLSEFGGVSFEPSQGSEDSWGYSVAHDAEHFRECLSALLGAANEAEGLAGFCYTQLTDTQQETNGLCDAARQPKLPVDVIADLVRGTARR